MHLYTILRTALLVILSYCVTEIRGQVIPSEISPTNAFQLADEDGDYPDWIELFNPGNTDINLLGMGLSDDDQPKWIFPDRILHAGERLLVYASGKNRGGLGQSNLDHWETIINDDDFWRFFIGTEEPPADWAQLSFDATAWTSGQGGFGYGDNDDVTEVPADIPSIYYRRTFHVDDVALLDSLLLSMDYDDGFVAYLNGVEIARSGNMPPGTPAYSTITETDHEAQLYQGGLPDVFPISKNRLQEVLVAGQNVLAVEVHNVTPPSSDLTARTWLHAGINSPVLIYGPNPFFFSDIISSSYHTGFKLGFGETLTLFDDSSNVLESIEIPYLLPANAIMRVNDTGDWCLTDSTTAGEANGGNCLNAYAAKPDISPPAGFYPTGQLITIAGNDIRFTLDGSAPDENSPQYTGPITIDNTTVVRARSFEPGFLPGESATATYFIGASSDLPVLSITAKPGDLFNDGSGGLAVYDDYGSGRRAPVHLEYFDKDKQLAFSENASLRPVGGYSIAFDQKSMQFAFDEDFGARDEVHFPIFSRDKPNITSYREFRIRNMDDDWSTTRMRDVLANQLTLPTHCASTGYQHMAVFINGEYWGHYGGREVTNEYYVRDNHGANEDEVDQILTSYFEDEDYLVDEGSGDDFFDMSDFLINNDMSDPENFRSAQDRIDWENWVDYFAAEMYLANGDWFSSMYFNNTRIYRAPGLRWRYVIFDVTYAQGNGTNETTNILQEALGNPYYPNRYTDMMNSLLANPWFRSYFINRFADLMNEYWTPTKITALIASNASEIATEINKQSLRWGSADSLSWRGHVHNLDEFHAVRRIYQRNHIEDYFDLDGQADITLRVEPAGAGVIHINTIIPKTLPWAGVYFNGNPITITAVPNPGYSFDHWEDNLNIDTLLQSFAMNLTEHTELTAHFTGSAQSPSLELAEINYDTDPTTDSGDWVEILNTGNEPVDLTHYVLQNKGWYNRYSIPAGTVLQPDERYLIVENETAFSSIHPGVLNKSGSTYFNLDNDGDAIRLLSRSGVLLLDVSFSNETPWPCTPAGFGRTLERYPGINDPNESTSWFDGCMGGSPGVSFSPCDYDMLISEINYNDAEGHETGDWFEIKNQRDQDIDLSGWSIRDDDDAHVFIIPAGTILPAQGYFVFCESASEFSELNPSVTNYRGDLGFRLGNGGDVIRLYDAAGVLQFSLCYDDVAPWVVEPDGEGYTLELADPYVNVNDGFNWFAGCLHGSPGVPYDPLCGAVSTENSKAGTVELLPNPATDQVLIRLAEPIDGVLTLYDVSGRKMQTHAINTRESVINISGLKHGIYTVVVDSKVRMTARLIVH